MHKFLFYDPYASVFEDRKRIIEVGGRVIFDSTAVDWDDASVRDHDFMGLLELGLMAAEYLKEVTSRSLWDSAQLELTKILASQREMLRAFSREAQGIRYVSPMGEKFPEGYVPDWHDQSDPEIINAVVSITRMSDSSLLTDEVGRIFPQQFALAALEAIDSAILGVRFSDAGGTINPIVVATKCLSNAASLVEGRGSLMSFARQHGAKGGKASRQKYEVPRNFVQQEWALHHAAYKGKSDFARTYAKLVLQKFSVEVTEKTIRETWLAEKDAPPSG